MKYTRTTMLNSSGCRTGDRRTGTDVDRVNSWRKNLLSSEASGEKENRSKKSSFQTRYFSFSTLVQLCSGITIKILFPSRCPVNDSNSATLLLPNSAKYKARNFRVTSLSSKSFLTASSSFERTKFSTIFFSFEEERKKKRKLESKRIENRRNPSVVCVRE